MRLPNRAIYFLFDCRVESGSTPVARIDFLIRFRLDLTEAVPPNAQFDEPRRTMPSRSLSGQMLTLSTGRAAAGHLLAISVHVSILGASRVAPSLHTGFSRR